MKEKLPDPSDPVTGEAYESAEDEAYWREHHAAQPYGNAAPFEAFLAGYQSGLQGYERFGLHGRRFEDVEDELRQHYERAPREIPWERARMASMAAWTRAEERRRLHDALSRRKVADPVTREA